MVLYFFATVLNANVCKIEFTLPVSRTREVFFSWMGVKSCMFYVENLLWQGP